MIVADVATLDRHLRFLAKEASYLRMRGDSRNENKAEQFDAIAEILRQVRQSQTQSGSSSHVVGARLRYWPRLSGNRYTPVTVIGYTKSGRVRVRWPNGLTSAVTSKMLSVI